MSDDEKTDMGIYFRKGKLLQSLVYRVMQTCTYINGFIGQEYSVIHKNVRGQYYHRTRQNIIP